MNNKILFSVIVLGLIGGSVASEATSVVAPPPPAANQTVAPVITTTQAQPPAPSAFSPFGKVVAKKGETGSFAHCSGWIQAQIGEAAVKTAKEKLTKAECVKVFTDSTNENFKKALAAERTVVTTDDSAIPSACQFGQSFWGKKHVNSLGYVISNMCKSSAKAARKAVDTMEAQDKNVSLPAATIVAPPMSGPANNTGVKPLISPNPLPLPIGNTAGVPGGNPPPPAANAGSIVTKPVVNAGGAPVVGKTNAPVQGW